MLFPTWLLSLLRTQSSCYHHLVMSTDRSSWYHHPRLEVVSWTCTSSCDHHLVISRHAIIILTRSLWVVHTDRHAIIMRCRLTRQNITAGSHARSLTRMVLWYFSRDTRGRSGLTPEGELGRVPLMVAWTMNMLSKKILSRPAVGNSPPFWTNLHFHDFPKTVNH